MPALVYLAGSWILGAFAGASAPFGDTSLVVLAVGVGMLGLGVGCCAETHRRRVALTCATVAAAAAISARSATHHQDRCRQLLAGALSKGDSAFAVFDGFATVATSGQEGSGPARGIVIGRGALAHCRVPLVARVRSGAAPAGRRVIVTGQAQKTTRGIRIDARLLPSNPPQHDWRRAARGRAGALIDRDFGANAPMVRALLIADQDGIASSVRDVFADAGLVHMLSISGLHVAIIAGALLVVLRAARFSPAGTFSIAMIVVWWYVAILGAPPPAVRSAVMLGVVGLSERMQRPVHPWTALALGAVIPTYEPTVVLDLGWQLSVSGMAALVAARAMLRRARLAERRTYRGWARTLLAGYQELRGWRRILVRELVTGTVATMVTAPLIAWTFGRVSVIAPLTNVVASPLIAFIQPTLFLSVLTSAWPALSGAIADAAAPALAGFHGLARAAAQIPHATVHLAPTAAGALCAGIASAAVVRATASRRWLPGLIGAAFALTGSIWLPMLGRRTGELELHLLDVGQGDALAIRTPRGRWILVDAGRRWDGGDAGRRTIVPYVRRLGGEVAALILTHAHDDHIGGASSIIESLSPRRVWEPGFVTTGASYRTTLETVRRKGSSWRRVRPGDRMELDGVQVLVLAPDSAWTSQQRDANETSVVLRVQYGGTVMLLTGDAEREEEAWILRNTDPAILRADVLKVGHHGSKTSSTPPFVEAVSPRIGLVSVGARNSYRHPSPVTLETFTDRGVPLIRTDLEGTLVISTDGRALVASVGAERWVVPPR